MKPREERQKVMIKARMRSGVSWHDVCIVNLSAYGLGIQTAEAPERGTYVEICRGSQMIIARVAWSKGHRFGLRAQDAISIRALMSDPAGAAERPRVPRGRPIDRRRVPRTPQQRHERSRVVARAMEFAGFGIVAAMFAVSAFGAVEQALARPLSQISAALH